MKKIYLALAFIISIASVNAQSFSVSNVYINGNPLFLLEGHATVTNNSSSNKDVMVQRTVNNLYPGHSSYFCWFDCYGETVSLSQDPMTINAGASLNVFKGYLDPYTPTLSSVSGISMVTYCFFDAANIGDSVCVDYLYDATTGLMDIPAGKNYISKPFPNPASESASFYVSTLKGSKNVRVKIYNMLGAEVKDAVVPENKNAVKINISELKSGIYFYSLWINGKSSTSGKLMVSKN
jgi:hypothetical protein